MGLLSAGFIASCSDDDNATSGRRVIDESNAPKVVSVIPNDGASDIDTVSRVVITYDREIFLPPHATIRVYSNDTDYVYVDSGVVANGKTLTFPITTKGATSYKIQVLKPTVRDTTYAFASDYEFSFTTRLYNNFVDTLFNIADAPVNENATDGAKALYAYLKSQFGKKVLSAAIANVNWNTENAEAMYSITGKYPAINCFDFIHHINSAPLNPSNWIDYTDTKVVEDWADNNGIVSCMWHWNVPKNEAGIGKYSEYTASYSETEFSARNATRTSSWQYAVAEKDMDIIADYLLALQAKGIAVLWRPLHEAAGNVGRYTDGTPWFWWGNGGSVQFKKLWQLMYNRFKAKGVNNLIWVWTSEGTDAAWYPGDDYVDIIARDYYCKDKTSEYHTSLVSEFEALRLISGGKKMIAFSEGDAMPSVANMLNDGAVWSWCMPWYGKDSDGVPYINSAYNTALFMTDWLNSEYIITRDELPALK